jgi:hypothetical protein
LGFVSAKAIAVLNKYSLFALSEKGRGKSGKGARGCLSIRFLPDGPRWGRRVQVPSVKYYALPQ